ncbi:hypothetical protein LAG90_10590 [Marinilongibacter aquaticus]|uniref:hypothetical protein n=1 Tax=Marinilongibacter aquaticus TaxID=2975157 RepID=UPI0021BCFE21|nr:hypothetical protein [Marinilongibacter aquaticus]UBM57268.1 hypothetical protein LAG90_10590 [Marinilongibacter aquaticus]
MWKKLAIVLVLVLFFSNVSWAQCAMCRATVGSNLSEGRGVIGTGLNFGILYLLLTPYILVGALILAWYRTGKKEMLKKLALNKKLQSIYGK